MIELVIPGDPVGKGRPKVNTKTRKAYTPAATKLAERHVKDAWMAAGRPQLPRDEGAALWLVVIDRRTRARDHYRTDGVTLSAKGLRNPIPTSAPDFDNVAKLVSDALNRLAYRDDAQIAAALIWREWAPTPETVVRLGTIETASEVLAAVA